MTACFFMKCSPAFQNARTSLARPNHADQPARYSCVREDEGVMGGHNLPAFLFMFDNNTNNVFFDRERLHLPVARVALQLFLEALWPSEAY